MKFINISQNQYFVMLLILVSMSFISSCSFLKKSSKEKPQQTTVLTVDKLRMDYIRGDVSALDKLIAIYRDKETPLSVRKEAAFAIGESKHPTALQELVKSVSEADAIDFELYSLSVNLLGKYQDDPQAREALLKSFYSTDKKLRELQESLFISVPDNASKKDILALLDVYEKSRAAYQSTAFMVSKTLARMNEDEVIPFLVFIANDKSLTMKIRNQALEILSQKKDHPEVVSMFVQMLTDPSTELQMRDFALRTMKDVKDERLILTLLETYKRGQNSYYSLLSTLIEALGEFNDPTTIPTLIEMTYSKTLPTDLRIKALLSLGSFHDPVLFEKIIPLLEEPENYIFYPSIIDLADVLGVTEQYKDRLREAALTAQSKATEKSSPTDGQ